MGTKNYMPSTRFQSRLCFFQILLLNQTIHKTAAGIGTSLGNLWLNFFRRRIDDPKNIS